MGESVVEGKVSKWLVKEGDLIETDQPIAEVSTDKVDVEIPSPGAGTLEKIFVPEGETVSVGTELALIQDGKEQKEGTEGKKRQAPSPPSVQTAPPAPARQEGKEEEREETLGGEEIPDRISPLVKKLAKEHQIDLRNVPGTGIGGRITKQDVMAYIEKGSGPPAVRPPEKKEPSPARPTGISEREEFSEFRIPIYEPKEGDQVIPFSRLRKMIAEHMVYSKRTAPHVTTVTEVDMMKIVRLRNEKKGSVKEQTGSDLTFLPFIISAAIQAISAYPTLNASVSGDRLIVKKEIHMGIAVETDKGLVVPVIRRADEKSLIGLSRAAAELARKAREGTLAPDDIAGGTFTISNPGKNGNLFGTPIIFQPQVGILRMGEVIKRPIVVESDGADTIAIHPMMYLSLSYDHRVIDGATGNLFLHRVKEILQEGRFTF